MAQPKRFDPSSTEPFKLSRNRVEEFVRCARCFVLTNKHGLKKPSSPPFTLNSAVDALLKKEFDVHRKAGIVHPLVAEAGLELVPFQHPDIDIWRSNFKGIQFHHKETNFLLTGAVDDIWVTSDGKLVVIDYKATAKAEPMRELPTGGFYDSYRRQLDFYRWLLVQNGFEVDPRAFWLYETGRPGADRFDQTLEFDAHLIEYVGSYDWVEGTLRDIRDALMPYELPAASEDCEHCAYSARKAELEEALDISRFPNCHVHNVKMHRVLYGMRSEPAPPFHVDGGCLMDSSNPQFVCPICEMLGTNLGEK